MHGRDGRRVNGGGGFVVVEHQRSEGAVHRALDVVGEHAEDDVGADAAFKVMVDGAYPEKIEGLAAAKRPLDATRPLVGPDGRFGR